jgi:hypothetical protein
VWENPKLLVALDLQVLIKNVQAFVSTFKDTPAKKKKKKKIMSIRICNLDEGGN